MATADSLGQRLYDRGWRQGVTFGGPKHGHFYDNWDEPALDTPAVGDAVVLITQDCDLVKTDARVPYLEGIPAVRDSELARSVRANDQRYFVLHPASGLVADRAYRIQFTRASLVGMSPDGEPCGGDIRRLRRFGQWLGSAYDRPALPEQFHSALSAPLAAAIANALRPSQAMAWLNEELHEVRAAADIRTGPPWEAELIFVVRDEARQDRCDEAIAEILAASGVLDPARDVTVRGWKAARLSEISVLDYAASFPISMDVISGRGDAALPLRADPD